MREALAAVASDNEDTSAVKMSPQLQHRLRGTLNAAGFKRQRRNALTKDIT